MFRHYTIDSIPVMQTAFKSRMKLGNEPEIDIKGVVEHGEFFEQKYPDRSGWMIFDVDTLTMRTDDDGYVYYEHRSLYVSMSSMMAKQIDGLTQNQIVYHFGCLFGLVMILWPPLNSPQDLEELDDSDSLITKLYHENVKLIRRQFRSPVEEVKSRRAVQMTNPKVN